MASSITFRPAVGVRTYERIVDQVEEALTAKQLSPGDHLPSERMLMEQFDVSRSTVREALRVLESRGLVELRHGGRSGPRLLEPSPKLLERDITSMVRLGRSGFGDLIQLRMALDGTACAVAAHCATDEDVEDLRGRLEAMEAAVDGADVEFARADAALHERIWAITGNDLLVATGQAVTESIVQLIAVDLGSEGRTQGGGPIPEGVMPEGQDGAQDSLRRDRILVDLIAEGDGAGAGSWIRRCLWERFEGLLEPDEARTLRSLVS
ncbi:FadR/GntR family transcriptional regulator [Nesterenkonia aerolata]|uniref:GntR family transcriptional regulator n=1 Tax=Nesterenkonia aerolata TaxID=3074079 RepID=A0ABU2DRA1_9MICC|nr:GntR family transcriptional regulator [Nesterenkonia sp. LY-0111]MDR8019022.1 GntR family transcriptional regulator [Nesterenkonia sp. LY-0111]